MKRIILISIILIVFNMLNAVTVWIDDKDDSSKNSIIKWKAEKWQLSHNDSLAAPEWMPSPFYRPVRSNLDEIAFDENSDFNEEDGWVLLSVYLGGSKTHLDHLPLAPHCVLYNTQRGIIRYFYKNVDTDAEHSSAFARMIIESGTGILSTINTDATYIYALDQRNNNDNKNAVYKYEEIYSPSWMYADFYVAYDNDLNILNNPNNKIYFLSRARTESNVDFHLDGKISPQHSATNKNPIEYAFSFGNDISEYISKGNNLRDGIRSMPDKLANRGAIAAFTNKLTSGFNYLDDNGITGLIPYINQI